MAQAALFKKVCDYPPPDRVLGYQQVDNEVKEGTDVNSAYLNRAVVINDSGQLHADNRRVGKTQKGEGGLITEIFKMK